MKKLLPMLAAALLCPTATHAEDCKVEVWKWSAPLPTMLVIEGVTTCKTGKIVLRLYEGEGGPFLGIETDYIEGHTFKAMRVGDSKPKALAIKYVIERQ